MRSGITPGGVFPDYALPDHTGTVRTLSELQGRDPLILTLARGHYSDWDLSTPGLREAWAAGDYSPFHGWDRRGQAPAAP
jgi:hypothetical protein